VPLRGHPVIRSSSLACLLALHLTTLFPCSDLQACVWLSVWLFVASLQQTSAAQAADIHAMRARAWRWLFIGRAKQLRRRCSGILLVVVFLFLLRSVRFYWYFVLSAPPSCMLVLYAYPESSASRSTSLIVLLFSLFLTRVPNGENKGYFLQQQKNSSSPSGGRQRGPAASLYMRRLMHEPCSTCRRSQLTIDEQPPPVRTV